MKKELMYPEYQQAAPLFAREETPEEKTAREGREKIVADEAARKKLADEDEARKKAGMTDEAAKLLKEVMEKKEKLQQTTAELDRVNAKLKDFDGIDPVEIRKLLEDKKRLEQAELEKKGEWEKLKGQMNEAHTKELGVKDTEIVTIKTENQTLNQMVADLTVGNAFGNSSFIKDEIALTAGKVRALYGPHFEFKDGKVIGYDKPAGVSGRTMFVDGRGEPLAFEEALKKIVDTDPDKDSVLKSKIEGGAGSRPPVGKKKLDEGTVGSGRERIAEALRKKAAAA